MADSSPYAEGFYEWFRESGLRSANCVVPLVLDLIQAKSVIDVGCGLGTWLSVFQAHGVDDVVGVDGDHVKRSELEIPGERFLPFDLEQPLRLDRRFDLVVSLEVAEHLSPQAAGGFVDSLVSLGPYVLFSAAIPEQGGTGHVNEQWPSYWARLFARHGYVVADCLRRRIWENDDIDWWYRQNILLFGARAEIERHLVLRREAEQTGSTPLPLVHPGRLHEAVKEYRKVQRKLNEATRTQGRSR